MLMASLYGFGLGCIRSCHGVHGICVLRLDAQERRACLYTYVYHLRKDSVSSVHPSVIVGLSFCALLPEAALYLFQKKCGFLSLLSGKPYEELSLQRQNLPSATIRFFFSKPLSIKAPQPTGPPKVLFLLSPFTGERGSA